MAAPVQLVAIIGITTVLAAGIAPAAPIVAMAPGDTDPPVISWDSTSPLLMAQSTGASTTARLLNNTGVAVTVTIHVDPSGAIVANPQSLDIDAGSTATVSVTVAQEPAAASYVMTAVTGAGTTAGSVARRTVVVGPSAPVPASSAVTGVSTWLSFETWPTSDGPGLIPLSSPTACADTTSVKAPAGFLHSDRGDVATVSVTCTDIDGRAALLLEYSGLSDTGATYTGDLSFGDKSVSVTVRRTAGFLLPILALLAGFGIALWLLGRAPSKIIKPRQQRILQIRAAVGTRTQPGAAIRAYRQAAAGAPWATLDIWDDATTTLDTLDADLNALKQAKRFSLTADAAEVTELDKRIAAAHDAVNQIPELGRTLAKVQAGLPVVESTNLLPKWSAAVRGSLLTAGTITLAEIPEFAKQAAESAAICATWGGFAVQAQALIRRSKALTDNTANLSPDDGLRVTRAAGKLDKALAALARAETNSGLRAALANEYRTARGAIDELAALPEAPPAGGVAAGFTRKGQSANVLIGRQLALPDTYHREIEAIADKEQVASWVTVAAVLVILLVAGLQALVVGKAFGTAWDFLVALSWGAGSAVIAQLLAPAIEGLNRIQPQPMSGGPSWPNPKPNP